MRNAGADSCSLMRKKQAFFNRIINSIIVEKQCMKSHKKALVLWLARSAFKVSKILRFQNTCFSQPEKNTFI
jgi:hypothetical protein